MNKNKDKITRPPAISIVRVPHGFFHGGISTATISPPITTSSFECNTLILIEYKS